MPNDTITSGQSFTLSSALPSGTNIDFVGVGGTLTIEPGAVSTLGIGGGTIENFRPGDFLTISNLNSIITELGYGSDAQYATALETYNLVIATNGSVTSSDPFYGVVPPATRAQIQTIANEIEHDLFGPGSLTAPVTLSVIADPGGFADAVVTSAANINPCFAAGTCILLADGTQRPVEALAVGDEIALHGGATAPVIWIGKRNVAPDAHPEPAALRPVLIAKDALGDGLPLRDLNISPDHALFFQGHLIPAKALINGFSVRQMPVRDVTYYHVELARHAVLLAENVPAESYLDTGNRNHFENGGPVITLHPQFAQSMREDKSCAPLVEDGSVVEAVRKIILDRAGIAMDEDAQMQIRYEDGEAVILSRTAIPGEIMPDPRDRRALGVKIGRLEIGGQVIALDHPALREGWHAPEPDGRWTNGRAVVPASLLAGASSVQVSLSGILRYPVMSADEYRKRA